MVGFLLLLTPSFLLSEFSNPFVSLSSPSAVAFLSPPDGGKEVRGRDRSAADIVKKSTGLTTRTNLGNEQIPKPNEEEGLGIKWPAQTADMEELKKYFEEVKAKM